MQSSCGAVRLAEPDAHIVFKPHPDVEAGLRAGGPSPALADRLADTVARGASLPSLFAQVDEVHTLTSLTGFEALMREIPVTTYGVPFYAGWGLTRDRGQVPARRTARRSLDELVAAALILYPRYLDPQTRLPCPPEVLVSRLAGAEHAESPLTRARRLQGRMAKLWRKLGERRSFLFLQGPVGPFFRRLGRSLEAEGHRVARVNFHGGDEHDWPRGVAYRGRMQDWPQAAARLMEECRVTDLALYGDCRPLHRTAIDAAKAWGAAVHVFEEAYFRPGYMTLERGGTNGFSSLPRTPGGIRAAALQLGGEAPQPFAPQQPRGSRAFFYYARAQRSRVFGSYPYAEWHRDIAPWREGVAYARRFLRSPADRRRGANSLQALGSTRYFLLPLQMNRDYQMRVHSPYVRWKRRWRGSSRTSGAMRRPAFISPSSVIRSTTASCAGTV